MMNFKTYLNEISATEAFKNTRFTIYNYNERSDYFYIVIRGEHSRYKFKGNVSGKHMSTAHSVMDYYDNSNKSITKTLVQLSKYAVPAPIKKDEYEENGYYRCSKCKSPTLHDDEAALTLDKCYNCDSQGDGTIEYVFGSNK